MSSMIFKVHKNGKTITVEADNAIIENGEVVLKKGTELKVLEVQDEEDTAE